VNSQYQSWSRYPAVKQEAIGLFWRHQTSGIFETDKSVLAHGLGRSYGDVCLNDGGRIVAMRGLNRLINFDAEKGILSCEAGVSLAEILEFAVPQGYFLPVTPGTKLVTVGGAIANDVHGKNHHRSGTFGRYITRFELLRSDGNHIICSADENSDLYRATIGGLGLTGIILWADIELKPIESSTIKQRAVKFKNLDDFFIISAECEKDFEYTVAWIDCLARGISLGRGIFMAGNHKEGDKSDLEFSQTGKNSPGIPLNFPGFALNKLSIKAFNELYYHRMMSSEKESNVNFDKFFYPLDSIDGWNKIYGKQGPLQYQCVVPFEDKKAIRDILDKIAVSGLGSFLAVLKVMGDVSSPGLMSFPQSGVTLALDFPLKGDNTFQLFNELDKIVRECGGRLYPAKDAAMSGDDFRHYYPQWEELTKFIDPKFSSSFWKRVTPQGEKR